MVRKILLKSRICFFSRVLNDFLKCFNHSIIIFNLFKMTKHKAFKSKAKGKRQKKNNNWFKLFIIKIPCVSSLEVKNVSIFSVVCQ